MNKKQPKNIYFFAVLYTQIAISNSRTFYYNFSVIDNEQANRNVSTIILEQINNQDLKYGATNTALQSLTKINTI